MPTRKELNMETFEGRFAARMLELRLAAGLSQEEAAEKIGVKSGTIFNWENGKRQPNVTELPKIAQAYGVSAREIIPENF